MSKPSRIFYIHLLLWILFILLPVLFIRNGNVLTGAELQDFYVGHLIRSTFIVLLFYLNYYLLIPKFLLDKKRIVFGVLNLAAVVIIFFMMEFLQQNGILSLPPPPFSGAAHPNLLNPFVLTLVIDIAMSIGISLYQKLKQSERKKSEVELTYLKSRLNPHFLFNTLNSVYALAVKKSDETPDAISRLSSIMRYLITESQLNKVALEKEVNYIGVFIELQKLRLTNKTVVEYRCEGITAGKQIVPLLLISFVENAFKYGVSTEINSVIRIFITIKGDQLKLEVENDILNVGKRRDDSNGLGIDSARQMLTHFYLTQHFLHIEEVHQKFKVKLTIQLA